MAIFKHFVVCTIIFSGIFFCPCARLYNLFFVHCIILSVVFLVDSFLSRKATKATILVYALMRALILPSSFTCFTCKSCCSCFFRWLFLIVLITRFLTNNHFLVSFGGPVHKSAGCVEHFWIYETPFGGTESNTKYEAFRFKKIISSIDNFLAIVCLLKRVKWKIDCIRFQSYKGQSSKGTECDRHFYESGHWSLLTLSKYCRRHFHRQAFYFLNIIQQLNRFCQLKMCVEYAPVFESH